MKTANKIFYSVVSAKLFAIGLVVLAATSQSKLNNQINIDDALTATTATATTIELASVEQKQTEVIYTKRLNLKEKVAMDLDQAHAPQANVQLNKKICKIT